MMPTAVGRAPLIDFRSGVHRIVVEPSPKRLRVMFNGKTVADTLCAALVRDRGRTPQYYFAPDDVRMELLSAGGERSPAPPFGDATHWTVRAGNRAVEDAAISYEDPPAELAAIKGWLRFDWDKADHWFEEDEEVFGHARDPHHRVDVRPSSRKVRVMFADEVIASTRRPLLLFETGLPTRYYIPPGDIRMELLTPSRTTSICPYKGHASYWSIQVGMRVSPDAAWAYLDPLPECPRIKGHFCFYPEKVDLLEIEGEVPQG